MIQKKLSELTSEEKNTLLNRAQSQPEIVAAANEIVIAVKNQGFVALQKYSKQFDNFDLTSETARSSTDIEVEIPELAKKAMQLAIENIRTYAEVQKNGEKISTTDVELWTQWIQGSAPALDSVNRVGIYVPGGLAPLPSSLLMAAVTAQVAGVQEIVVCTPPEAAESILYAAKLIGISEVYQIGGAQAIAALTFGIPELGLEPVDLIAGPGNAYVAAAKELVTKIENVRIDVPAGPSEVLVIADETADPKIVAADLLTQSEHGTTSSSVCFTTSASFAEKVSNELEQQLNDLPNNKTPKAALDSYGAILTTDSIENAIQFTNEYAPEHVSLYLKNAEKYYDSITAAGSVFIDTPEAFGDYGMTGSNHILPTGRTASEYSGVTVYTFNKKPMEGKYVLFQKLSRSKQKELAPLCASFARLEGLEAHARAADLALGDRRRKCA